MKLEIIPMDNEANDLKLVADGFDLAFEIREYSKETADEIVRRVNLHEELIERLKELKYWYNEVSRGNVTKNYDVEEKVNLLLQKATNNTQG